MMVRVSRIALFALLAALPATALSAQSESYIADLTAAAEVPGPGARGGTGLATLDWHEDEDNAHFCYAISVENIGAATAAHLHRGAAGVAGPPVITFETPDALGGSDGCIDVSPELRREIRTDPGGFYVNVHNADRPDGAVRGQLERCPQKSRAV